jgi:hypothetical protein
MAKRRHIPGPVATLAALGMLAPVMVTGCDAKERAVDCAKLAIAVSRSYDELERTALTAALDEDPEQFTDALRRDAEKVRDRTDNVDVRRAADAVLDAATEVRQTLEDGRTPELSVLGDATAELTRVCTPVQAVRQAGALPADGGPG